MSSRRFRLLIPLLLALGATVLLGAAFAPGSSASPEQKPSAPVFTCPDGYLLAELNVYGQRIESNVPQASPGTSQVIVQNGFGVTPSDPRYVVALACARQVNGEEYNALFFGRSPSIRPLPFTPGPAPVKAQPIQQQRVTR